ncbi:hypothetical protein EVAR_9054_1 [Eumeta japonica]|uniref:Uncharacterized protein n=1 Tax=Eumeta variegata TaxID=151549 RepID=A0A4C1TVZ0_EUMVA|nr:hypothetical protein EVAR_9054_1 [Eumeta japonica]
MEHAEFLMLGVMIEKATATYCGGILRVEVLRDNERNKQQDFLTFHLTQMLSKHITAKMGIAAYGFSLLTVVTSVESDEKQVQGNHLELEVAEWFVIGSECSSVNDYWLESGVRGAPATAPSRTMAGRVIVSE